MNSTNLNLACNNNTLFETQELEYKKDIWNLDIVGIKPPPYIRSKSISFTIIEPIWLKNLAKKYIRFQASSKAYYTLLQYLRAIKHFSEFLQTHRTPIKPEDINRTLMLNFISYIHKLKSVNEAKNKMITNIKHMMMLSALEGWENITNEKIMYRSDRLPFTKPKPRYIPSHILEKLNRHIHELPEDIMRFVMLLQHTGRRIGEICALPLNCTIQDAENDYFLKYYEFKIKKEETIPINHEIARVIDEQRKWVIEQFDADNVKYLFTTNDYGAMDPNSVRTALNHLGAIHGIKDHDGKLWNFQPHQFRHTVGTQMINAGVPAHVVQRYLKHSSPDMTMQYAHLHDSTMKAEFAKFQGKLVDVTGKVITTDTDTNIPADLKWLKRNVLAQALPNGYCGIPIQQGGCPHANACLSCSHFKTTAQFVAQHKNQLQETKKILATAEENGWIRQIEMNKSVKNNLENIISALENAAHWESRPVEFHHQPLAGRVEQWRSNYLILFPSPAASNAACGFPALRLPGNFIAKLM